MKVAARASPLSRAQVQEIQAMLSSLSIEPLFVETKGDFDQKTSLRTLNRCDFFTKEIDRLVLEKKVRAGIHSAKDLPEPLSDGLAIAAITSGVDPRDALVLRSDCLFEELPLNAWIATSSVRREEAVRSLRSDLRFCDIRGTIEKRLAKLQSGEVDGVVIAEAAIVRLGLCFELNRIFLPGDTAENQGRLAVVVRKEDQEAMEIFSSIDGRTKPRPWTILHLGLDPASCPSKGRILHYPVIRPKRIEENTAHLETAWKRATHLIFTSKTAIRLLPPLSWEGKVVVVIGEKTAELLREKRIEPIVAPFAEQEGVIELLERMNLSKASFLWPRSNRARPVLLDYFSKRGLSIAAIDLYEPVFHRPGVFPPLDQIDEIVFMSPSCVEGFRRIHLGSLPKDKKLTFQGRITSESCEKATLEDIVAPKIADTLLGEQNARRCKNELSITGPSL